MKKHDQKMNKKLQEEALAFDRRVQERVLNGLIPDLQNCQPNEWFYNNPWRHPEYVQMVFGEYLSFALKHIDPKSKILEVGSGLGHMTLELSRLGHYVSGVELSDFSVKTAKQTAEKYLNPDHAGSLKYHTCDFLSWSEEDEFDVICFFLTLHHFENLEDIITKASNLLSEGGKIIVVEPARDLFSKRNATIAGLIRIILSFYNGWHEKINTPLKLSDMDQYFEEVLLEYREAKEKTEQEQSPNDNSAYAVEMIDAIKTQFSQDELKYGNSLVPRLVGGVRANNLQKTLEVARFIKLFDSYCTDNGFLDPGVFYFAGTKKTEK